MHIHVTIMGGEGPRTFELMGRLGWAMVQLAKAGAKGVTPIERPAPRWSGYIHELRGKGIAIDTARVVVVAGGVTSIFSEFSTETRTLLARAGETSRWLSCCAVF